jgi:hypothetical protein
LARADASVLGVARILILFAHPGSLRPAERGGWADQLADELRQRAPVALSPIAEPSEWNWLLEIDVESQEHAEDLLQAPATRDLLLDLRLLGSRPRVVVAG